jgi:N-acetylneuraminic acid mutarotase
VPTSVPSAAATQPPRAPSPSLPTIGGSWAPGQSLPTPRSEIAAAVLNGRLYVAGGFGNPRATILDDFLAFDPATGAWTELAPLPQARHHAALTALDGRLYLTGGGVEGFAPRGNT